MTQPIQESTISDHKQDVVLYQSNDGEVEFHVNVFNETVWLTQKQMVRLFERERSVITKHIRNVFKENELEEECNVHFLHIAYSDKPVKHYSLDVVISVGYRVKSSRGTQFRKWSNQITKKYMLQGRVLNEARLHAIIENSNEKFKEDIINEIKILLDSASERPINISINNQIASSKLEDKLIDLIDEVIRSIKSDTVKHQLEDVKQDIQASPTSSSARQRVSNFFKEIGDTNSNTRKAIKGAGIAKNIITEIIKLGSKLKDLI